MLKLYVIVFPSSEVVFLILSVVKLLSTHLSCNALSLLIAVLSHGVNTPVAVLHNPLIFLFSSLADTVHLLKLSPSEVVAVKV